MELIELAKRFHALFAGLERCHGTYNNIDNTREDGKRQGKAVTKREPVTDELWAGHLAGKNGIGIVPIRDDSTVVFGAIDIDVYTDLNPATMAATLARLQLPLVVCRSKSGGVHLYLFTKQPVPAGMMVEKLRDIAASLGHGKAELFPKQVSMSMGSNDLGSWINMPLFDMERTNRYAVKPNGDAFSPEGFLEYAESQKVGPEFFDEKTKAGDTAKSDKGERLLPDGPPCLQHLIEMGFPEGTRNGGLFNLGVYYRKARPDWVECGAIEAANQKFMNPPLTALEVQNTIESLKKKDYLYACASHPLFPYCNAVKCRTRKYGVGGGASSFPTLGQLRKLLTIPPVWYLDVTDNNTGDLKTLELSTDELEDVRLFRKKCISVLDIAPSLPSKVVWNQTLQTLLAGRIVLDPPPEESASTEGQFWELLEEFCADRAQAQTAEEILLGMTFTEKGRTYFRTNDLLAFLVRKGFKEYKVQQLAKVLKMRKNPADKAKPPGQQRPFVTHDFKNIGGKGVNVWSVPEYPKRLDPFDVPDSITHDEKPF